MQQARELAEESRAWQMAQEQMQQQGAMARALLSAAGGLNETMTSGFFKAMPYAPVPGQEYFLGWEPGGVAENIARMSGRSYDPTKFRAPILSYSPGAIWDAAKGAMGL